MNPQSNNEALVAFAEIANNGCCELPESIQPPNVEATPLSQHIQNLTRQRISLAFPDIQFNDIGTENWFTIAGPPHDGVSFMRISHENKLHGDFDRIHPIADSPIYNGSMYGVRIYDSSHRLIRSIALGYEYGMRAVLEYENLMTEIRYIFNLYNSA